MRQRLALLLACTLLLAALLPGTRRSAPVLAQVPVPPVQERPTGPQGTWAGGYWRDGAWTFLEVAFVERRSRWAGTLTFPYNADTGEDGEIPLESVRYNAPTLQFTARTDSETLNFLGELVDDTLTGQLSWDSGSSEALSTEPLSAEASSLHLRRIVRLDRDYGGYAAYVGDYRILPDETPYFVGRAGLRDGLYLSWRSRHIGLLPLGADRFLTTTGHELTFERFDGGEVVGFIIDGENPLPWELEGSYRQVAATDGVALQATAVKVGNYRVEEVRFGSSSARLAGTVLLPHGPGPYPAVVFAQGLQPETRERHREIAAAFARHGIASIIYDKRGIGASTGDPHTSTLYELVEDALDALRLLKPYHEIDHEMIGIWGHSHGGWVAPLAAIWSEEEIAFVVTVSGAGMTPSQQELYHWRNRLLDLGAGPREMDAGMKAARLQQDLNRLNLYGTEVFFLGLDPDHYAVSVLERLQPPILAIWGEEDRTVPPWTSAQRFEAALARAGNEDVTLRIFSGAGHNMSLVAETEAAPGITDGPWVSFPPGYVELMAEWTLARTTEADAASGVEVDELPDGVMTVDEDRAAAERLPPLTLPWYGRIPAQAGALLVTTLLLLSGGVVWTGIAFRRLSGERLPWRPPAPTWALLAAGAGALLVAGLLVGLMVVLVRFLIADPAGLIAYLRSPVVRGAAWLAPVTAVGLLALTGLAWVRRSGTAVARAHLTAVAVAALGVLPVIGYWRLWG